MSRTIEGDLIAPEAPIALVVGRFNQAITRQLLEAALHTHRRHGGSEDQLTVVWVPGSFELPVMAKKLAQSGQYEAVICLGCVIRGQTGHYDHVAGQAAAGIAQAGLATGVPVIFGVITADTHEQALDRAGMKLGNQGASAMLTAIEMVSVFRKLDQK